jgi:hypothetical protein
MLAVTRLGLEYELIVLPYGQRGDDGGPIVIDGRSTDGFGYLYTRWQGKSLPLAGLNVRRPAEADHSFIPHWLDFVRSGRQDGVQTNVL